MKRYVLALMIVLMMAAPFAPADDAKEDLNTVTVKGLGTDEQSALDDGLRKAVEQGGKLKLYAESKTENYELIHDTILSQATGLIKEYKVLKKGEDDLGGYFVEIEAVIDRQVVDATWGQVEILLRQLGRPKILVSIVERIHDTTRADKRVEQVDADSLLGNMIEKLLVDKGFALVDKGQIEQLKQDQIRQATLDNDTAALKRLATELGAQMYIVGNARASGPQLTDAYGTTLYMWETDVTLKAFWSETAAILFAENKVGDRSGSRTQGPPGAKKAIEKSGQDLAKKCLQAILQKWSRQATSGGQVVVTVNNLAFKQMLAIQKKLEAIDGVKEVHRQWNKPVAKFEIKTTDTAEKFVEKFAELEFDDFALDIEDQKFNTITASVESGE